jgi:hypothetical protein
MPLLKNKFGNVISLPVTLGWLGGEGINGADDRMKNGA